MRNDFMIDLETLGTTPDAVVCWIGAVHFNVNDWHRVPDMNDSRVFLRKVSWHQPGRVIDPDTVRWWMEQDSETRRSFLDKQENYPNYSLEEAIEQLFDWMAMQIKYNLNERDFEVQPYVWANGSTFDISILDHAFKQHSKPVPWSFRAVRDMRTVKDAFIEADGQEHKLHKMYPFEGVEHNALDDAYNQARQLCAMWSVITGKNTELTVPF